jgi:glycosyltransferase involved in cell wall biosynthesis
VITVVKDDLTGLKKTRESVKSQQFSDGRVQHVIVDGGSENEIFDYLISEKICDPLLSFISEPDQGIYDAMNKGVDLSNGEVICWLNAGDVYSSDNSLNVINSFLSNPKEQWGYGITALWNSEGALCGTVLPAPYNYERHTSGLIYVPHPSSFIGKNLVHRIGPYDKEISVAADQIYLARAASLCDPITIPVVLTNFAMGGVSSKVSPLIISRQLIYGVNKHNLRPKSGFRKNVLIKLESILRLFILEIRFRMQK